MELSLLLQEMTVLSGFMTKRYSNKQENFKLNLRVALVLQVITIEFSAANLIPIIQITLYPAVGTIMS